ncbi:hypothetical protein DPMN_147814 [Dreissena polymorpha]|uniref:Uncharacterized protein n=1 Tax=Dreissena polymorpha TaxID=45954 RepID=A0A9D4J3C0_DREPO|nr:hypothetical protein DPMN_147814 [Dreissena polymorpha]
MTASQSDSRKSSLFKQKHTECSSLLSVCIPHNEHTVGFDLERNPPSCAIREVTKGDSLGEIRDICQRDAGLSTCRTSARLNVGHTSRILSSYL